MGSYINVAAQINQTIPKMANARELKQPGKTLRKGKLSESLFASGSMKKWKNIVY